MSIHHVSYPLKSWLNDPLPQKKKMDFWFDIFNELEKYNHKQDRTIILSLYVFSIDVNLFFYPHSFITQIKSPCRKLYLYFMSFHFFINA